MKTLAQEELAINTPGRGTYNLTSEIAARIAASTCRCGLVTLFVPHTSASLILCENADPQVRHDLEAWLQRAVPDGDALFGHRDEGPDDMPAHVRATLTSTSLTIPIQDGRLLLGTWQGIYLYEHRTAPHHRRLSLTVMGNT